MNISNEDYREIKVLANEAFELAELLPNITEDVVNTNIHYRIWKLRNIINKL